VLGFRLLTLQYLQTFRSGNNEVRAAFLHLAQVAIVTAMLGFRLLSASVPSDVKKW
jgi:hypothetical protein